MVSSYTAELSPPGVYPKYLEADVLLSDGTAARLRPIREEDGPSLLQFHAGLSQQSIYRRFFGAHPHLSDAEVKHFTNVDYVDRLALVAEVGGKLVAVARYDRLGGSSEAEVAFVVSDAYQGRGLGTLLLEHLAAAAAERGMTSFTAQTLAENGPMRNVFASVGFSEKTSMSDGIVDVRLSIRPTETSLAAAEERDRKAAAASVQRLLHPNSVAVVGAGRSPGGVGHEIFTNILRSGFTGVAYPVNTAARSVGGVRAYPSVSDIPDSVDLAVIAVPAEDVNAVLEDCGAKGVASVVVVSAGFAESGRHGAEEERQTARLVHQLGMRMVGPNCLGVANLEPKVSLNATFAPSLPRFGCVGLASQSGGIGIAVFEEAARRGLGLSSFVSLGNKADVSGNDILSYWEDDRLTSVILLYLESFGNPRRFIHLAGRIGRIKPVVVVKSGRIIGPRNLAWSHTGALASSETVVRAALDQAGALRADSLGEMLDLAEILASQPIPQGRRVAVVGNAGGPGILTADACVAAGLELPELSARSQELLASSVAAGAALDNPVELVASAGAEDYGHALEVILEDPGIDSVIVVFAPPMASAAQEVARSVARASAQEGATQPKPVLAAFLTTPEAVGSFRSAKRPIPCFTYPETAAIALGKLAKHAAWRSRPQGHPQRPSDARQDLAQELVASVISQHPQGRWLSPSEAAQLVGLYGIPVAELVEAKTPEQACAGASQLGFPVALKASSPGLVHKSDVGGVRLDIRDENELKEAWQEMSSLMGERMEAGVVQAMSPQGIETIAGVLQDPLFGPVVLFGLGGTAVEVLGDQSVHLAPLTTDEAAEMMRELAGYPLLQGYRGAPPANLELLKDLMVRLGWLCNDLVEVAEADLNPVVATPDRVIAVDIKIRIALPAQPRRRSARRLS